MTGQTLISVFSVPLPQLNGSATINSHVRPISLEKSKVRGGTECSVASWGYRTATVTSRGATVTIIKQRDCLSHYPGLADNLICGRSRSSGVPEKVSQGRFQPGAKHKGQEDPCVPMAQDLGVGSSTGGQWPGQRGSP